MNRNTQVESVPVSDVRPTGRDNGHGARPEAPTAGYAERPGYVPGQNNTVQPGTEPSGYVAPGYNPYGYRNGGYAYAPAAANHEQITIASGANLILGLWLIAAPFVLNYASAAARGNDVIVGIIVASLAALRVFGAYRAAWLSWLNALIGVWLVAAPFVLVYTGASHAMGNDIIVGLGVIIFGVWSAIATHGRNVF